MKISCKWLRDYIDIGLNAEEIAELLTNTGLEVEEINHFSENKDLSDKLKVGFVKKVAPHPDADKLTVCTVDIAEGHDLSIICGAPNVKEGQKVVVAPINTELKTITGEKIVLKKAKIRGIFSEGMICAEDEIGLGHDHSGIIVLPPDASTGQLYRDYLGIYEDEVLEVAITPNRADATSHIGVARDIAAFKRMKLKYPSVDEFNTDESTLKIEVNLPMPDLCPRYCGVTLSGVKVGESPVWLKNKLKAIGLKPVNNIVDVTNFVLFETGQPLHAFDAAAIRGKKIVVRTEKKGSEFKTLIGTDLTLDGSEIMICDAERAIGMGGIMGGAESMISGATENIFIESAAFNPSVIRRTSRLHGIISDASYRFERGSDPEITLYALKRAALLIRQIAGGKISSEIVDVYPGKKDRIFIKLNFNYLENIAGCKISSEEVISILKCLEYRVLDENSDEILVEIPAYRTDVTRPVDLAEEVLRIYSYENIPVSGQLITSLPGIINDSKIRLTNKITELLVSSGFFEILSPSFINSEFAEINTSESQEESIKTLDAKNSNFDTMRSNLLISGLEAVDYNLKRNAANLKFFEFAKSYFYKDPKYTEKEKLGIWITGSVNDPGWNAPEKEADYYYIKSFLENILKITGIQNDLKVTGASHPHYRYMYEFYLKSVKIAFIGLVNGKILSKFDIKKQVLYAEIDMNLLEKEYQKRNVSYTVPSKFPFIMRDISVILNNQVSFSEIRKNILSINNKFLKEIKIADVYKGGQLNAGEKSYLIRLKFQDENQTLKDEQVDKIMSHIIKLVESRFNATIRK